MFRYYPDRLVFRKDVIKRAQPGAEDRIIFYYAYRPLSYRKASPEIARCYLGLKAQYPLHDRRSAEPGDDEDDKDGDG